ncbi:hypothetical protein Tco_1200738 [Tanacetum coccineum]
MGECELIEDSYVGFLGSNSVYGSRKRAVFFGLIRLNLYKEHDYSSEDESVQGVGSKENKYNTYEKEEGEFNNSEDEEVAETDFMEKSSQSMDPQLYTWIRNFC